MNKYLNLLVLLIISSSIAFEPTQEVNYGIPTTKIFYDDEGNQYNQTTDPSTGFTFTKIITARSPNDKANIVVKDSNGNIIPTNSVYSKNTPNSPNYIPSQNVTDKNGNIVQTSFNPEMNTLTTEIRNPQSREIISTNTTNTLSSISTIMTSDDKGNSITKNTNPNNGITNTIITSSTGIQTTETKNDRSGITTSRTQQADGNTLIETHDSNMGYIVSKTVTPSGQTTTTLKTIDGTPLDSKMDANGNITATISADNIISYNSAQNSITKKASNNHFTTTDYDNGTIQSGVGDRVYDESTIDSSTGMRVSTKYSGGKIQKDQLLIDPLTGKSANPEPIGSYVNSIKDNKSGIVFEQSVDKNGNSTTVLKYPDGKIIPATKDANGIITGKLISPNDANNNLSNNQDTITYDPKGGTISTTQHNGPVTSINTTNLDSGNSVLLSKNDKTGQTTSTDINGKTGAYTTTLINGDNRNRQLTTTNSFDPVSGIMTSNNIDPVNGSKIEILDTQTGITFQQAQHKDGNKTTLLKNASGEIIPTSTDANGNIVAKLTDGKNEGNTLTFNPQTNTMTTTTKPGKGTSITTIKNMGSGAITTNTLDPQSGIMTTKKMDTSGITSTQTIYPSGLSTISKTMPNGLQTTQVVDQESGISFSQKTDNSGKLQTIMTTTNGQEIVMLPEKDGTLKAKLPNQTGTINFDPKSNNVTTQLLNSDGNTSTTTKGLLKDGATTVVTNKNKEVVSKISTQGSYDPVTGQLRTSTTKNFDTQTGKVSTSTTKSYISNPDGERSQLEKTTTSTYDPVTNHIKIMTTNANAQEKQNSTTIIQTQKLQPATNKDIANKVQTITNPDGSYTRTYIDQHNQKRVDTYTKDNEKISSRAVFKDGEVPSPPQPNSLTSASNAGSDQGKEAVLPDAQKRDTQIASENAERLKQLQNAQGEARQPAALTASPTLPLATFAAPVLQPADDKMVSSSPAAAPPPPPAPNAGTGQGVNSAPPVLQKSPDATISTVASVPTSAPPKTPEGNAAPASMRPVAPPPPGKTNPKPLASGAPATNGSSGGTLSPAAPRGSLSNNTPPPIPQSKEIDSQLKGNKPGTGNDGAPPVANTRKDKRENRIVQLERSATPSSITPPPRRPTPQRPAAQIMTSEQELMTRQKARTSKVKISPSPSSSIIPPKSNSQRETIRNKNSTDAPSGRMPANNS